MNNNDNNNHNQTRSSTADSSLLIRSPVYTTSCPSPIPACYRPLDDCPAPTDVSSRCGNVKMSVGIVRNVVHLESRPEFCATMGQSSLKPIKPGLSREHRDKWDPYERRFNQAWDKSQQSDLSLPLPASKHRLFFDVSQVCWHPASTVLFFLFFFPLGIQHKGVSQPTKCLGFSSKNKCAHLTYNSIVYFTFE